MSAVMHRIKVVNDMSELVPILRAVDSPVKLKLVQRLADAWLTGEDVEREFGKEGTKALAFFEKLKLIDTRWVAREGRRQPEKSYHFYYSTININTTAPFARGQRDPRRSPRCRTRTTRSSRSGSSTPSGTPVGSSPTSPRSSG